MKTGYVVYSSLSNIAGIFDNEKAKNDFLAAYNKYSLVPELYELEGPLNPEPLLNEKVLYYDVQMLTSTGEVVSISVHTRSGVSEKDLNIIETNTVFSSNEKGHPRVRVLVPGSNIPNAMEAAQECYAKWQAQQPNNK